MPDCVSSSGVLFRETLFRFAMLIVLCVSAAPTSRAQTAYMNDSYYHSLFIRKNCACSSPIHPQARFCGSDIVIAGVLKSLRHDTCNISLLSSKGNYGSLMSCTELHFVAVDVLHSAQRPQKRTLLQRAMDRVARTRRIVLTIPKSNLSTCNFDLSPTTGQQYIVSANFLGKRFLTYSCYHVFEPWRQLNVLQRRAYTKQLYESNCRCQIVQNSFYVKLDWPRRQGSTPRSKQCWWQPGSSEASGNFDRTAYCKLDSRQADEATCQWQVLAKSSRSTNARKWAVSTDSNEIQPKLAADFDRK